MESPDPAGATCYAEGCDRPPRVFGLCKMHGDRLKNSGTLDLTGTCVICGDPIPYKGKGRRQTLCSKDECKKAYDVRKSTEWRQRNPEKARSAQRTWRENNPDRHAATMRRNHLRREFDLTEPLYQQMLARQGGHCAICDSTRGSSSRPSLHVDHDHRTGQVRGLLCSRCNLMIGMSKDDPNLLVRAASYVLSPPHVNHALNNPPLDPPNGVTSP